MTFPTDADVIIPVTAANTQTYYVSSVGLRTARASTSANILALANNGDGGTYQAKLEQDCKNLGIRYHYMDGPFSISKAFNLGRRMTTGQYIAYGTADVIYYRGWLENIIELWEENPEWFALTNYSYDSDNMPCVEHQDMNEKRIVQTGNPSSGVIVLRRKDNYEWDEQFALWEIDADFFYYIKSKGLKAGYCLNARCDHMIGSIRDKIDCGKAFAMDDMYGESKRRVKAKWGKFYEGG